MPYTINRHNPTLIWVVIHGQLSRDHAEAYFHDMWRLLDESPRPTDLLVDGRRIASAGHGARQRTEQIAHHPHLGRIAFVVSEHHLLLFAPFVKLVSGVGLFGAEQEAITFLQTARADAPAISLPNPPPRPETLAQPATRFLNSLSSMVEGWGRSPRNRDD
jgi:hypothetical protein